MAEVKTGQIWKEVDPRHDRYVRVINLIPSWICIETVHNVDGKWFHAPGTARMRHADPKRFNGKRGGYELYQDARSTT
jgi:hypothetical protein